MLNGQLWRLLGIRTTGRNLLRAVLMIGPEPCLVQAIQSDIRQTPESLPSQLLHSLKEGAEEEAGEIGGEREEELLVVGCDAAREGDHRPGGGAPFSGISVVGSTPLAVDGGERGARELAQIRHSVGVGEGEVCDGGGIVGVANMSADPDDIHARAYQLCREYLHGAWKRISLEELVVRKVSGGLSNLLYYCALPEQLRTDRGGGSCGGGKGRSEPSAVLLRLYGQTTGGGTGGDKALEGLITESVIFALLSESQRGPCLFGVFPGGRLEEYIPARPLHTRELADKALSRLIAEKLAQIHLMKVPINKEPRWLWDTMERWLATIHEYSASGLIPDASKAAMQRFVGYSLRKELDWLREYLVAVRSPVVFCHNDLQEGNILLRAKDDADAGANMKELDTVVGGQDVDEGNGCLEGGARDEYREAEERWCHGLAEEDDEADAEEAGGGEETEELNGDEDEEDEGVDCVGEGEGDQRQLVVIDFEYCSYNYRGFDFANHMCEWMYDYSNEKPPYFTARPRNFPTRKQQERFVTWYLNALRREATSQGVDPPLRWRNRRGVISSQSDESEGDGSEAAGTVDDAEEIQALLYEIRAFTLASHFFWALWSIVNGTVSSIPFDYWEYGEARFRAYFRHKRRLLQEEEEGGGRWRNAPRP